MDLSQELNGVLTQILDFDIRDNDIPVFSCNTNHETGYDPKI